MPAVNGLVCNHCHKPFSCGCQKTTDDNGNTVHKACVNQANAIIRTQNATQNA